VKLLIILVSLGAGVAAARETVDLMNAATAVVATAASAPGSRG
jgi:hypothetical protein